MEARMFHSMPCCVVFTVDTYFRLCKILPERSESASILNHSDLWAALVGVAREIRSTNKFINTRWAATSSKLVLKNPVMPETSAKPRRGDRRGSLLKGDRHLNQAKPRARQPRLDAVRIR